MHDQFRTLRRTYTFTIQEPVFDSHMIQAIRLEGPDHDGALTIRIDFNEHASGDYIQRVMDALVEMDREGE